MAPTTTAASTVSTAATAGIPTVSKITPGSPRIIQGGAARQPVKVITSTANQQQVSGEYHGCLIRHTQ